MHIRLLRTLCSRNLHEHSDFRVLRTLHPHILACCKISTPFSTFVHQKMSAWISGHSIIYDSSSSYCSIARSGWHLPLCGVAVVSQVLCTSTTLNKRNTVSVQSPYNRFWIVTTFFMLFYLCDICITRIYKDIPRKLFRQGQSEYFIYFL